MLFIVPDAQMLNEVFGQIDSLPQRSELVKVFELVWPFGNKSAQERVD
jgi:hypothetical protein